MERVRIKKRRAGRKRVKIKKAKRERVRIKKRVNKPANRKRLTEEGVLRLPTRAAQYRVWDSGTDAARGLSVLVSPAGAKSYRSTYYFPGSAKPHSRLLDRVGQISLEKARALCRQDRANARAGLDPRADDPTKTDTFRAAVDEYVRREQIGARGNSSASETKRLLLKDTAEWHSRPVATIRPTEIHALLELVRDGDKARGLKARPYLANSLYAHLSIFFRWCARPAVGKLATSPMIGIDKPFHGERRRARPWFTGAAGDEAIKSLWQAAETIGGTDGDYLKLLILTGKRKTALAAMQWAEIDANWFWNAPQSNRKNKRLHPIPLPALAQRVLHPRKADGFVFPGEHDRYIHVRGDRLQRRIADASGLNDFIFHGVRHLVESKLAELRVAPHVRDLLLDHRPNRGSGAGYDHYQYRDEMLAALELWAAHVVKLAKGDGAALLR